MKKLLAGLSLLLSLNAYSQIFIDNSTFKSGNDRITEVYVGFPNSKQSYKDSRISYVLVKLFDENKLINQSLFELSDSKENVNLNVNQFNLNSTQIKNLTVVVHGLYLDKATKVKLDSTTIKLSEKSSNYSDAQIAFSIKKSTNSTSEFFKNGLEIMPNPTLFFNKDNPKLYYYYEVYPNLQKPDSVTFTIQLLDSNGEPTLQAKHKKPISEKIIDLGGFDITTLTNGRYKFLVKSTNSDILGEVSKTIYISAGNTKELLSSATSSQLEMVLGSLSASEVEKLFSQLKYIASEPEKNIFSNLKLLTDRVKFIEKFISTRAEENADPLIWYLSFMEKIEFANNNYRTRFMEGWKSDRGRVFIMFGPPSDIEKSMSGSESKPYETWTYNQIEGGIIFVFGDKSENGSFELIHSTKRGEMSNPDWQNLLKYNSR